MVRDDRSSMDNFYRGQITLVVIRAKSMNLNDRRSKYNDSVQITNRERESGKDCVKIEIYDAVTRIGTNYHPEATSIPLVMANKKTDPSRDCTTRPLHRPRRFISS